MAETTRTILTIIGTDGKLSWYPDYVEQEPSDPSEYNFSVTNSIEEAIDLSELEKEAQLNAFDAFSRAYDGDFIDLKMAKITLTTSIEDLEISEEYAEVLQKRAFEKLTPSEREALGLNKIFTYIKLKFHKAA